MTDTAQQPKQPPLLVIFPKGQLDDAQRALLLEHSILAIEADDPKAVVQMQLVAPTYVSGIAANEMLGCLLSAVANQPAYTMNAGFKSITTSGEACHQFVKYLAKAMDIHNG